VITVFADRSFSFITKLPPATFLIKQAVGLKSGSTTPGKGAAVARIKQSQIRDIAEKKMADLNANSIEMAMKTIEGSARSMGLEVVEG
jgi:large subunit ribosomal protein L11